ncbi:MAG TPA: glycosyltransferase [Streptosporangiaceae bacterium]|nr:glycosyltransferase [Streptosporangiaceae bacterium]
MIFIAGFGRSGSTMLERVLGEMPGFVNVGELIDIFRRAPEAERCGCGLPFTGCPFWTAVGQRAFGGWDAGELAAVARLQDKVARQRHMPKLLALRLAGQNFRTEVDAYGGHYKKLYRAIADEAGAQYVVDSSKWPVQALALARAGIDVRVIHLVRDARGVAYSMGKDVSRPHTEDENDVMWRNAPAGAAARWVTCQTEAELLRTYQRVTRVRYEDFVRQPRRTVETALTSLGLPAAPGHMSHIDQGRLVLGKSHGLSGNPSRFRDGEIVLRHDEAWRKQMPVVDRALVTTISLPFMLRYGRPRAATATAAGATPAAPPPERWPDVSVMITTRGRPELVRETIATVVAQDYPGDIDILIVHDQEPADEELTRLGAPGRRIRVLSNTGKPGLAGARNFGLGFLASDYVATCDDDDLWHPEKLRLQIARLVNEPDLLAIGSGIRLLLPGAKTQDWPGRAERIDYEMLLRNRVKELHSSTLVMRRDAYTKAGNYDENLPYGYSEDYDWVLRMAKVGALGLVIEPLADIRRNATSYYQGGSEKVAAGLQYLYDKHPDIGASRRGSARMLGQIAFARSSMGQRRAALPLALKALLRWPASPHPYIALVHIITGVQPRHLLRLARLLRRDMA